MPITKTSKIRKDGMINNQTFTIIRNKPKRYHVYLEKVQIDNATSEKAALQIIVQKHFYQQVNL